MHKIWSLFESDIDLAKKMAAILYGSSTKTKNNMLYNLESQFVNTLTSFNNKAIQVNIILTAIHSEIASAIISAAS